MMKWEGNRAGSSTGEKQALLGSSTCSLAGSGSLSPHCQIHTCFATSGAAIIDCQALSVNSFWVMRLPSPCCADTRKLLRSLEKTWDHSSLPIRQCSAPAAAEHCLSFALATMHAEDFKVLRAVAPRTGARLCTLPITPLHTPEGFLLDTWKDDGGLAWFRLACCRHEYTSGTSERWG